MDLLLVDAAACVSVNIDRSAVCEMHREPGEQSGPRNSFVASLLTRLAFDANGKVVGEQETRRIRGDCNGRTLAEVCAVNKGDRTKRNILAVQ